MEAQFVSPLGGSWEAPDWEAPAPGGWWRVVHKPLVYAVPRPVEPLLPRGAGYDAEVGCVRGASATGSFQRLRVISTAISSPVDAN